MQQRIEKSDFVIVVCTETYARRFTGCEIRGKGKGATWEGRLINQCLYESAENHRFVPVVFDRREVDHIPLVLKGATHYDLSTSNGYTALRKALAQPGRSAGDHRGSAMDSGPTNPHRPEIDALLRLCPAPLPVAVLGRATDQDAVGVGKSLRYLREAAAGAAETRSLPVPSSQDDSVLPSHVVVTVLQAELDFVDNHRNTMAGRGQLANVLALAEVGAKVPSASAQVSRTFRMVQTMLKDLGDKHLVLRIARQSIAASRAEGRARDQVKDEAVAAICGVSWVYQRTGRLAEALVEAERSLALGENIGWDRNTAFCQKCIGRLRRMQSETIGNAEGRADALKASVESLHDAIRRFGRLGMEAEVGDCYSLLARTYLVWRDEPRARDAIAYGEARLVDANNKDFLDLQIVKGDVLLRHDPAAAEAMYAEVVAAAGSGTDDAQRSEIVARAYLQRGRARAELGQRERSHEDLARAAEIWDGLDDPAADVAHWEIARTTADWMDRDAERVLREVAIDVRVRAAKIIAEETAARPVQMAQRRRLPEQYLRGVISRARERVAVDRPVW